MPEPSGFAASTIAYAASFSPPPNSARLFFNALAGRDARGPGKALAIVLRELRADVAAGKPVTADSLLPEAHRLSDGEREVWHVIATALAAAANESTTPE